MPKIMTRLSNFMILAVLSFTVAVTPTTEGGVRVPLIVSSIFSLQNEGQDANKNSSTNIWRRTVHKSSNNSEVPSTSIFGRADRGSAIMIPATSTYMAEVNVGRERFYAVLDTGATDSWFVGIACQGPYCEGHSKYDPSWTARQMEPEYRVSYATGAVTGTVYGDILKIAGVEVNHVATMAVNVLTRNFRKTKFAADGIIGLSLEKISEDISPFSFVHMLTKGKYLQHPSFSFKLSREPGKSEFILGYDAQNAYKPPLTWMTVAEQGDWSIPVNSFSANGRTIIKKPTWAVVDTGATLIFGPIEDVKTLYSYVEGAHPTENNEYFVPCDSSALMGFNAGGREFTFPAQSLTIGDTGYCYGSVAGVEGMEDWTFGQVLLLKYFATFQYQVLNGRPRIGLAEQA